jgi:hypothetical protein
MADIQTKNRERLGQVITFVQRMGRDDLAVSIKLAMKDQEAQVADLTQQLADKEVARLLLGGEPELALPIDPRFTWNGRAEHWYWDVNDAYTHTLVYGGGYWHIKFWEDQYDELEGYKQYTGNAVNAAMAHVLKFMKDNPGK